MCGSCWLCDGRWLYDVSISRGCELCYDRDGDGDGIEAFLAVLCVGSRSLRRSRALHIHVRELAMASASVEQLRM